jgi:hypothetical protein
VCKAAKEIQWARNGSGAAANCPSTKGGDDFEPLPAMETADSSEWGVSATGKARSTAGPLKVSPATSTTSSSGRKPPKGPAPS